MAPTEHIHFRNGNLVHVKSFMRKLQSQIVGDCVEPGHIRNMSFSEGKLYISDRMPTKKMQDILLGKSIDVFAEIPLGHRTKITGFNAQRSSYTVSYECLDPYVDGDDLPRHTIESIEARRRRMAFEAFFSIKLHWMTREILNKLTIDQLLKIDLDNYLSRDSMIILDTDNYLEEDVLTRATFFSAGEAPELDFGENVKVKSGAVVIPDRYPETLAHSLPGQSARKVIDHWMFENSKVNKVKLNKTTTRITFSAPSQTRSYAEDEPDKVSEILARLRRAEKRKAPKSVKNWEARIQEMEKDRNCDVTDRFEYAHLFFKENGDKRRGKIRNVQSIG